MLALLYSLHRPLMIPCLYRLIFLCEFPLKCLLLKLHIRLGGARYPLTSRCSKLCLLLLLLYMTDFLLILPFYSLFLLFVQLLYRQSIITISGFLLVYIISLLFSHTMRIMCILFICNLALFLHFLNWSKTEFCYIHIIKLFLCLLSSLILLKYLHRMTIRHICIECLSFTLTQL